MATQKQITQCVNAVCGLETAVADTFVSQSKAITETYAPIFGPANWELDPEVVEKIVAGVAEKSTWKGTGSERQRKSELRAVIRGYPFLKAGAAYFRRVYGTYGKEHLMKIARLAPECETAEDAAQFAVDHFMAKDKAEGKGAATQKDKLIAGLKQARNNCSGSAMLADLDAFLAKYKLAKAVGTTVKTK